MIRLRYAASTLALWALLLTACGRGGEAGKFHNPPVILISIDTLRADHLHAYGANLAETPNIDRLASDGVVFENAYSHVPLTLPSHTTMLTGRLPYENGVRSNIGYHLGEGPSLPKLLSAKGYATGGAVSSYVLRGDTGLASLFDFYDDSLEVWESASLGALQRRGDDTVHAALGWLDKVHDKPVFLFLHLFEPHTPYEPAEPFRAKYAAHPYDGEIATVDAILGRFLDELKKRDLYDDALIVLVSDHGEGLDEHGEAEHGVLLYREVLHVPMILKLPRGKLAGERVATPVQLTDILPTLTNAVGAKTPAGLPGASLIDVAEGRTQAAPRTIYSETLYPRLHLGWSELRSLTDAQHQYIESPDPELFDFVADPRETNNLRTDLRRETFALSQKLASIPLNLVAPGTSDPEERARLSALGYLSGAASEGTGPKRNPRDHIKVLARVQETFVLNQQGRYVESVALCRAILRDYPDLVDVYNQLAGDLRRLGRLQEALDAYHEAVRRSPQLVDSMAIEIAKLELDMGNVEAAELNAKQAMKLNPAEAHLIFSATALAKKQLDVAEREARLALGREDRPRVPALLMLARVLVEQKRFDDALGAADRAATRVREDGAHSVATLQSTRGDILARMGRNAEAEAAFRDEIKNFPRTTEAYARLALLLAMEHRFNEIGPTIDSMVTAVPVPATYVLAARVMSDLGNDAGADAYRRRAERK